MNFEEYFRLSQLNHGYYGKSILDSSLSSYRTNYYKNVMLARLRGYPVNSDIKFEDIKINEVFGEDKEKEIVYLVETYGYSREESIKMLEPFWKREGR